MPDPDLHVVPENGRWAVKREGEVSALSVHDEREAAVEEGRRVAGEEDRPLHLHDHDGVIQETVQPGDAGA
jgi:hypothetical protein